LPIVQWGSLKSAVTDSILIALSWESKLKNFSDGGFGRIAKQFCLDYVSKRQEEKRPHPVKDAT
jgi:hypothetical protein